YELYLATRPTRRSTPADVVRLRARPPRSLMGARGWGETLPDRRWVAQVLGYATMAGAEWCVLTDGDEYRLYNAVAAVEADNKLFCRIKLVGGREEEAVRVLSLISRLNMEENLLSLLWNAHFVD